MESVTTNPRMKTKFCAFFQRGQCAFGQNCSFAHHEDEMRQAPACRVVCVRWRLGKCNFGSTCPDLHCELDGSTATPNPYAQPFIPGSAAYTVQKKTNLTTPSTRAATPPLSGRASRSLSDMLQMQLSPFPAHDMVPQAQAPPGYGMTSYNLPMSELQHVQLMQMHYEQQRQQQMIDAQILAYHQQQMQQQQQQHQQQQQQQQQQPLSYSPIMYNLQQMSACHMQQHQQQQQAVPVQHHQPMPFEFTF